MRYDRRDLSRRNKPPFHTRPPCPLSTVTTTAGRTTHTYTHTTPSPPKSYYGSERTWLNWQRQRDGDARRRSCGGSTRCRGKGRMVTVIWHPPWNPGLSRRAPCVPEQLDTRFCGRDVTSSVCCALWTSFQQCWRIPTRDTSGNSTPTGFGALPREGRESRSLEDCTSDS